MTWRDASIGELDQHYPRATVLADRLTEASYPRVIEMAQSVCHDGVLGPCDDDVEFAFGLDLILDGLERSSRDPELP